MERIEITLTASDLMRPPAPLECWTIRDGQLCCTKTIITFAPDFKITVATETQARVSSSQKEGTQEG